MLRYKAGKQKDRFTGARFPCNELQCMQPTSRSKPSDTNPQQSIYRTYVTARKFLCGAQLLLRFLRGFTSTPVAKFMAVDRSAQNGTAGAHSEPEPSRETTQFKAAERLVISHSGAFGISENFRDLTHLQNLLHTLKKKMHFQSHIFQFSPSCAYNRSVDS